MKPLRSISRVAVLRRTALAGLLAVLSLGAAHAESGADPLAHARATASERAAAVVSLEASRQALAAQGESLAAEIARLKASGQRPLLVGVGRTALDERLRQHQALVGQLSQLDRQVDAARIEEADARLALSRALDGRIAQLRGEMATGDALTRQTRFAQLATLVDERARVSATDAPVRGRVVELPAVDPRRVNAEDRQALVDETQDQADHVHDQLAQVGARLDQLVSRRRMLRASERFTHDEALFGEDERVQRVYAKGADSVTPGTGRPTGQGPTSASGGGTGNPQPTVGPTAAETAGGRGSTNEGSNEASGAAPPQAPGAEGDFAAGATDDSDGVAADPSPAPPPVEPAPPPQAYPAGGGLGAVGTSVEPSLVVQDTVEPGLLNADVAGLGPDALADQIRQLEQRRRALEKTAQQLEQRRRALEQAPDENGD